MRSIAEHYLSGPWGRLLRDHAFLVCVVLLAVCGGGLKVGAERLKWHFRKLELPLQKPLDKLDVSKLSPYKLLTSRRIPDEIEDELGTEEYIQWVMVDSSVAEDDEFALVDLFVTYYTGDPERVPHVPDWCYVGSGGRMTDSDNIEIVVPHNGTASDELPVRILEISIPHMGLTQKKTVGYFFAVNGEYRCTRTGVRLRVNQLTDRYAYFSKVEVSFPQCRRAGRAEIIEAIRKSLQKVVPVLAAEHWPNWAEAKSREQNMRDEGREAKDEGREEKDPGAS